MTAANTTVLALLGKQVSFEYSKHIQLTDQTSVTFSKTKNIKCCIIYQSTYGCVAYRDIDRR